MPERAAARIDVWVWQDRYGGLHADWEPSRPQASVRRVPIPADRDWLQRCYGHLTRMIAERVASDRPVHGNRPGLSVRVWELKGGELTAGLTRRRGATVVTLPLPAELEKLQQWYDLVVGVMDARGIPRQARVKRKGTRVISVVTTERYPEAGRPSWHVSAGLPGHGKRR